MAEARVMMGHPTLNANVRAAAAALAEAGYLGEFHTLLDTSRLSRRVPAALRARIGRRDLPAQVRPYVKTHAAIEVARLIARSVSRSTKLHKRMTDLSYDRVDRAMASGLKADFSAVYAYEDGAQRAFCRAAELGIRRIYDLPIGYWRAGHEIMRAEAELQPAWASTLTGLADSRRKLASKDEELDYADQVVVASTFTARTLDAFPGAAPNVTVVPYGAPEPVQKIHASLGGPVRVLFVGRLTQRKGLSYFFEALDLCDVPVEAVVVGMANGRSEVINMHLSKDHVSWKPSLPHSQVLELMRTCDVLVFPSLFEGFGLVLTEALSQGLPIITTSHTAGPDLVSEGRGGWITPIRSAEAIAGHIVSLFDVDVRNEAKQAAVAAARRHTWALYGEGVRGIFDD